MRTILILCAYATLLHSLSGRTLFIETQTDGEGAPARVFLSAADGSPVAPSDSSPYWQGYVASTGRVAYDLAPGTYHLRVERGPEWSRWESPIEVQDNDAPRSIVVPLHQLVDMHAEGWYSGETHIHRPIELAEVLLAANDLDFGQWITWWNQQNLWAQRPLPGSASQRFADGRTAFSMGGEDERDGGARLFSRLQSPVDLSAGEQHFPSSVDFAQQARQRGAWIDLEKPFWWDTPMWAALGLVDAVGIANNHLYRDGGLANEAWGKPRPVATYPGARGNGLWTQEIYFQLLNGGLRLPPTAGSASGVLPNPVGYNRVYVHLEQNEPTWEDWLQGIQDGRAFVTNGPLLRVRANGKLPGNVFRTGQSRLEIQLTTQLHALTGIERFEVILNGEAFPIDPNGRFEVRESGWFLVRAITTKSESLGFAMTAPFYVEMEAAPVPRSREKAAEFFLRWIEERQATLRRLNGLTPDERASLLEPWEETRTFWEARKKEGTLSKVRFRVNDADTGAALPARVYLRDAAGGWRFVDSASDSGSAIPYEKRNWNNTNAEEFHTTVSADPFEARLEPGEYSLRIERGQAYLPAERTFRVDGDETSIEVELQRWVDPSEHGWFSGDTHVHRTLAELPNLLLAEDLNVAFPLTYWVTDGERPPTLGDKTTVDAQAEGLIEVDATHVIWPRNTEWEIFRMRGAGHTLGAVFALGHSEPFTLGAPPVTPIAAEARQQGAFLDLDKHDWPWSMTLPVTMGVELYELANNHIWRTEFGFTQFNSLTPPWLRPFLEERSGGEREWIRYTFENYYSLLNAGLNMVPTAGTANGVHPVPLGFGRVYVQLDSGFDYEAWKKGLADGRSFVSTGPMPWVTLNGELPGHRWRSGSEPVQFRLEGIVQSASPISYAEVIHNGVPVATLFPRSASHDGRSFQTPVAHTMTLDDTGWIALRVWEEREGGRIRYAHTAPWHFQFADRPYRMRAEERDYLVARVVSQIERSRGVLPDAAIEEYNRAKKFYESRPIVDETDRSQTRTNGAAENRYWLENMAWHGFRPEEVDRVLPGHGANYGQAIDAVAKVKDRRPRILPFPGGRHPRNSFFDGALAPQRETKFSAFLPWDPQSYVVIDLPEALWSNLGLTYLAHTHIDTVWDTQGIDLAPQEWERHTNGSLRHERMLPNGISFGATVNPAEDHIDMELWMRNGSEAPLSDLRIQNCVMLEAARGFHHDTNHNKRLEGAVAAVRNEDSSHWIVTAWERTHRAWANPPVPCLHADPQFPDLPPGAEATLRGELWFVNGKEIDTKIDELNQRFPAL